MTLDDFGDTDTKTVFNDHNFTLSYYVFFGDKFNFFADEAFQFNNRTTAKFQDLADRHDRYAKNRRNINRNSINSADGFRIIVVSF